MVGSGAKGIDNVLEAINLMIRPALDQRWGTQGKVIWMTYLPTGSPIIGSKLVILQSERVGLRVGIPRSFRGDDTVHAMLSRQIIRGKLDHGKAGLEFTFSPWWPVDAHIKLNTLKLGAVIDVNVRIVSGSNGRDTALDGMVKLLVDEVQNQNLVLVNLYTGMISSVCSFARCSRMNAICAPGKMRSTRHLLRKKEKKASLHERVSVLYIPRWHPHPP